MIGDPRRRRVGASLVLAALTFFVGCTSDGSVAGTDADTPGVVGSADTDTADVVDTDTDEENEASAGSGDSGEVPDSRLEFGLPVLAGGQTLSADLDGPRSEVTTLRESPYIGIAKLPRPDYEANPWSQWGQGIMLDDGRVISAIGDHLGADGNSYLFVYDPEDGTVTRFADVLSSLDHEDGSWGYGKVHSQMVDAGDGGIYFTTYYGTRSGLTFDGSYEGDVLFRLDTESLELTPIAVPVPGHGVPSLATDGAGLLYGEAVDPLLPEGRYPGGGFFVFDTTTGETTTFVENPEHAGFRSILVEADGRAMFARDGGGFFEFDPASDEVAGVDLGLGSELRAVTEPTSDGTVYGVTFDPYELFALDAGREVRELGEALWYSASLALLPDESGFLYVPGAHGDSSYDNTPLIAVDGTTGAQTRIVELFQMVKDEYDLVLGGTYSITVDPARNVAHIGFNAGRTVEDPWGEVMFLVVELP